MLPRCFSDSIGVYCVTQSRYKDHRTFKERSCISQNFWKLEQGTKKFFSSSNLEVKDSS